ncbi:MAG: nuclear transport factor 2 family protein [Anaerolineales bacterium]|nr:nuclear transport factor 2 family protein [Anaerolineales bacterium]
MKTLFQILGYLVLSLSLAACGGGAGGATATDPESVLEALEAAHNAKDPDGVAALYAEDGYEVNNAGTFTGREKIRNLYAQAVKTFSLDCDNYVVEGSKVTYQCVLTAYSSGAKTGERYEAVVENGLIKSNVLTEKFTP